jgi:hypothetical protein
MAQCVVEGAKQVQGAEVSLYQAPEIVSGEVLEKFGFVNVPVARVDRRNLQQVGSLEPVP